MNSALIANFGQQGQGNDENKDKNDKNDTANAFASDTEPLLPKSENQQSNSRLQSPDFGISPIQSDRIKWVDDDVKLIIIISMMMLMLL